MMKRLKGMVDRLTGYGGASEDELRFARAYLAPGDMDAAILAMLGDAERLAERDRMKVQRRTED